MSHPGDRLRALMDSSAPVAAPGCFNGLVGMAAADAGFGAAYVSGAATSVAAGVPDVGLLGLEHFCRVIREVADGSRLPVLADADTGFGEAEMVRRTVFEYHRAGAAGLHIEDQVFPKRCGHLEGKTLIPLDAAATKVRWAVEAARECSGGSLVVCARTDAYGVDGYQAALERAHAYAEAGADMIFPEGFKGEDELGRFAEEVRRVTGRTGRGDVGMGGGRGHEALGGEASGVARGPAGGQGDHFSGSQRPPIPAPLYLLANMTEFGKTPLIPLERWGELGYDLVIYPVTMLRVAMGAVVRALAQLREQGTVEPFVGEMQTRQELYDMVRYTPGVEWPFMGER